MEKCIFDGTLFSSGPRVQLRADCSMDPVRVVWEAEFPTRTLWLAATCMDSNSITNVSWTDNLALAESSRWIQS